MFCYQFDTNLAPIAWISLLFSELRRFCKRSSNAKQWPIVIANEGTLESSFIILEFIFKPILDPKLSPNTININFLAVRFHGIDS